MLNRNLCGIIEKRAQSYRNRTLKNVDEDALKAIYDHLCTLCCHAFGYKVIPFLNDILNDDYNDPIILKHVKKIKEEFESL